MLLQMPCNLGLYVKPLCFPAREDLHSPLCNCVQGVEWGKSLPPVLLLHGTSDTCALVSNATQFSRALEEAGAQVCWPLWSLSSISVHAIILQICS